jgi:hypothetical protein
MANKPKNERLKKHIDALAIVGQLYPFLYILYVKLMQPPFTVIATGAVCMLIVLPSAIWSAMRYAKAPLGTYPLVDLYMRSGWFRVLCIAVGIILGLALLSIT